MLQNLHTHTTFCDGKNTPEQMIAHAIRLGFDSIGFSSHAPANVPKTEGYTAYDYACKDVEEYKKALLLLKKKYEGIIDVYIGSELDAFSYGVVNPSDFDYTIASVHLGIKDGVVMEYDHNADMTKKYVTELYGGDSVAYAKDYYSIVASLPERFNASFVGHFDVITKFNERYPGLVDSESRGYRTAALEALDALRERMEFFEVNTGAISRGYRTAPYPESFILSRMKELKCKLILTSDCHDGNFLNCHFAESREYLKSHGIDTLYYLTSDGFVGEKIL